MEEYNRQDPIRWLQYLFYVHIASLVLSLVGFLPVTLDILDWVSRFLRFAVAICLFQLGNVNGRYRKAGLFLAISIVCSVITMLLPSTVINLVAAVMVILSNYQEYSAHSDSVDQLDPVLSRKWHSLFNWNIIASVLITFASIIATFVTLALEMGVNDIVKVVYTLLQLPGLIIGVTYLRYLHRTIGLIQNQEE